MHTYNVGCTLQTTRHGERSRHSCIHTGLCFWVLRDRSISKRVLVRTFRSPMVTLANTARNSLVGQFCQRVLLRLFQLLQQHQVKFNTKHTTCTGHKSMQIHIQTPSKKTKNATRLKITPVSGLFRCIVP